MDRVIWLQTNTNSYVQVQYAISSVDFTIILNIMFKSFHNIERNINESYMEQIFL